MAAETRRTPGIASPGPDQIATTSGTLDGSEVGAWATRIRPHLAQAVEGIVAAGRELIDAKAALPHGQFGPLLDELGIGERMAQRFMRVAAHPVLGNPSRVTGLPAAIGVLDELTRLPDDDLEAALVRGDIGPGTTRDDVKRLARAAAAGQMTLEEAEAHTEQLRSDFTRLDVLIVESLVHGMGKAELVRSVVQAAAGPVDGWDRELHDTWWATVIEPRVHAIYAWPTSGPYSDRVTS